SGRARTVRSPARGTPSASCRSTIAPGFIRSVTQRTCRSGATGRCPSGCTVQNTQGVPRRRTTGKTARLVIPHGARKQRGAAPAASAIASWPRTISRSVSRGPQSQRLRWLQVWLPTSCPSLTIRRTRSGAAAARRPIRKNVAVTPSRARISRTFGVCSTSGPSSNVRAATRSALRPCQTLHGRSRYELHVYAAHNAAGAASHSAGVRVDAPCSCPARPLRDEQGDLPLLNDLVALIQDGPLLDDNARIPHQPLCHALRDAADGIADAGRRHELPFESHEGQDNDRRLRKTPAESPGKT